MNYVAQTAMILQIFTERGEAPTVQPSALVTVPLFHVTGEVPVFLQSFALGRKLVLMPKWDASEALRLLDEEKITYFVGVPLMSWEIAQHPDRARFDLSSCQTWAAGTACHACSDEACPSWLLSPIEAPISRVVRSEISTLLPSVTGPFSRMPERAR